MSQELVTQNSSREPSTRDRQASERQASKVISINRPFAWRSASNLLISFKYAAAGLVYTFQTQRNFRIHVFIGSFAIGLGLLLQVSLVEIAVLGLTIGAVMSMELVNTAIESLVDLTVKQSYHELAKIAKDCAAGAVLVSAMVSLLVGLFILVPPLLLKLQLFLSLL